MPPDKITPKKKADSVDPSIDSDMLSGQQDLRRQAETKLSERKKKTGPLPAMDADIRRLVHELEVHQIELETQNEELMKARGKLEAALDQYTDLYDFAPVGYFTLARDGTIHQVNLTGANLLGMERGSLIRRRFGLFVSDEFRASFIDFLEKLFECREKGNGEFILRRDGHEPLWVQIEASCLDDGQECRAMVVDTTGRKKKEERISFQANMLDAVGQAVIATDLSGTIIYWNQFAERLYGWLKDEAVGKNIMEVNVNQVTKEQAVEIMAHLGSGEAWSGEFQVQRRDGATFPAFVTNSPIRDADGVLIGIIGVSSDISERKQVEDALRASERRYRTLTHQIPSIVYVDDATSDPPRTQYISPYMEEMLGYTPEEWLEGGYDIWVEAIHPEDREWVLNTSLSSLEREGTLNIEYRLYSKTRQIVWVQDQASVLRDGSGKPRSIHGVIHNITEHKQAEQELIAIKEELERLFQLVPDLVCIASTDGYFKKLNPAWEATLGFTLTELYDEPFESFIHPDDIESTRQVVARQLGGNYMINFVNRYRAKDGSYRLLEWHGAPAAAGSIYAVARDITEREQAEQALQESRSTLLAALSSMTDAVFISNADGQIVEFNDAFVSFHKFKNRTECSKWLTDYPEILDVFLANGELAPLEMWAIPRALRGETVTDAEYTLHRKDTGETWIGSYNFAPIRTKEGEIVGSVVVAHDITERKQAEETLRQSEERFSKIFQNSPVAISLRSVEDWRCVNVNEAHLRLSGYTRKELIGKTLMDTDVFETDIEYQEFKKKLLKKQYLKNIELKFWTKSGEPRDVIGSYESIIIGREKFILASFQDITERVRAEQELSESKMMIEGIINTVPVRIFWKNKNLVYLGCNEIFARDAGLTDSQEIIGKDDYQLGWRDQAELYRKDDRQVIENGYPKLHIEEEQTTPDGNTITLLTSKIPLRDEQGEIQGVLGTYLDITEKKLVEDDLRQSREQLRALTNYQQTAIEKERAHIARELHDQFGQLLAGLKMDLSWLARHLEADSAHQERFRSMNGLIDEAIDVTRRIASELRPGLLDDLGLFPALEWLSSEFDRRSDISCTLTLPPKDPDLEPDLNTALFRIFQECLTNVSRHAQASRVEARLTVSHDELQMELTDNGRGISKSELQHVNSYGLLGMQERVAQWGGTLQITGKNKKGTTVMVKIPLPALRQNELP